MSPTTKNNRQPFTNTTASTYKQHKLNFATTLTSNTPSNSIYQLKQRSMDLNLRSFHNNYNGKATKVDYKKDYLRQIGIYLKGNYNIKRITNKSKESNMTTNRRSARNTRQSSTIPQNTTSTTDVTDTNQIGSILSGYVRCYVEDYMALQKHSSIRVLFPSDRIVFDSHQPIHQVQLSSSKFNVFDCVINTSPNHEWVQQSITYSDMKHALTRGNYGS